MKKIKYDIWCQEMFRIIIEYWDSGVKMYIKN